MVAERELGRDYIDLTADRKLAIWWTGVYNRWSAHYRQRTGREPFDRMSISRYIKEESYFDREQTYRLDGTARRCYLIDLDKANGTVLEIANQIEHRIQQAQQPPYYRAG